MFSATNIIQTYKANLFVLIILFASVCPGYSQLEKRISGMSMVKPKSIILRWAPASIPVWQTGIKYGYIIRKHVIARNGAFLEDGLNKSELLTKVPVKPKADETFDSLALVDRRAAIVQEALYGTDNNLVPSTDFKTFMKDYEDKETRLGFALFMCDLSADIAKAAGLQFVDNNIIDGERYVYSISPANIPDGLTIEPALIVADAGFLTVLPSVSDIRAIFLDRSVKFRWQVTPYRGIYSAYIIEKSFDGRKFLPVSDLPVVNLTEDDNPDYFSCSDSLENGTETFYRIRGISPFGEAGPPSGIISGKGIPDFSAYASVDTAILLGNNQVIIKWRVTENSASPVKNINVFRSSNANGPYEKLNSRQLTSKTQTFTDKNPQQSNYYKIVLTGDGERTSSSFPYFVQTEDNEPPLPPEFLSGTVDSTGKVTLIWKENREPDLLGYKVFRANSANQEFIALEQGIIDRTVFYDSISLNTLAGKICYQVIAIDRNYNSSDYSPVIELSRPDTIQPSPALITRIDLEQGKAIVRFEGSPANDITEYTLKRLSEYDTASTILKIWKADLPETYEDVSPERGTAQVYTIITIDKAGNGSGNSRKIYVPRDQSVKIPLTGKQSKDGKTISLRWTLPEGFIAGKTVIYRGINSEPVSIYATLSNPDIYFIDKEIDI
ncbi:MAG: hypothetical protein ACM3NR_02415, partial [Methanosarcina sp.]